MKLFSGFLLVIILTGCSNLHHVSPARFKHEAAMTQSFYSSEYIGQADGKAYLLRKRIPLIGGKWKEEILCTDAKGLDAVYLKQLDNLKEKKGLGF